MRTTRSSRVAWAGVGLACALVVACSSGGTTPTTPTTDTGTRPTDGSVTPPVDAGTVTIPGVTGRWTQASAGTRYNITGLWGSDANNIFAVAEPSLLRYTGGRWTVLTTGVDEMGVETHFFGAVGGADAMNIWVAGITNPEAGSSEQGRGLLWRWSGTSLGSPTTASPGLQYGRIWMASATDGWMLSSQGPLHLEGGRWTPRTQGIPTDASFNAIWGSGPDNVYVVGQSLYRWDGSAWSEQMLSGSNYYFGIWGSGANDVWLVGNSAARHWDGTQWSVVRMNTPNIIRSVWGAAANDVWAVGDAGTIVHWNGTAWTAAGGTLSVPLLGVWGSSAADVWAVGEMGTVLHYTR